MVEEQRMRKLAVGAVESFVCDLVFQTWQSDLGEVSTFKWLKSTKIRRYQKLDLTALASERLISRSYLVEEKSVETLALQRKTDGHGPIGSRAASVTDTCRCQMPRELSMEIIRFRDVRQPSIKHHAFTYNMLRVVWISISQSLIRKRMINKK